MGKSLSADAVERYNRDGVLAPISVLSPNEVAYIQGKLEEHEHLQGAPMRGSMMFKTHLIFQWVDELIRHPKVLNAADS
jgi:non-haem Fe2+, alpha-ketoglutarate-dependent halogenase